MADKTVHGILAALVTPMSDSGRAVNHHATGVLVDHLITSGVHGLVPCGSTGEFTTMTLDERKQFVEKVAAAAAGRVPVIPHTGGLSTAEVVELTCHAESAGVDAVMIVPPFYEQPPWAEIKRHYATVAQTSSLPIMAYHFPSAMGYRMSADQLEELATEVPSVRYLKDSSGDGALLEDLLSRRRRNGPLEVFNGWDTLTFHGLAAGARASVWGAANFIPELCVALYEALGVRRDLVAAAALWDGILPICQFLESQSYAAAVKAGCELRGIPVGPPRAPMARLGQPERAQLAELITAGGTFKSVAAATAGVQAAS